MATYNNNYVEQFKLVMNGEFNVNWLDEPIERVPGGQGCYRLMCLLLFKRRMTYGNMYVFTYAFHKNKHAENELLLKEAILKDLAKIYYFNNGRLPDGFEINTKNE
jgi:hypothetical protein